MSAGYSGTPLTRKLGIKAGFRIWFPIGKGVRGLLVPDDRGAPVVYALVKPASHYYLMMTHSPWMPALADKVV